MRFSLPSWLGGSSKRSADFPDKVYIQNDGLNYEYSDEAPAAIHHKFYDLLYGQYSSQNFINLFYCLPEIFAPINEIAKRVSDAQWELCRDWNDEVDYSNVFFNERFTKPNPMMSFKDFVYQAVCYEILIGKQFFYFNKVKIFEESYKNIVGMWNLPAQKVKVVNKENFDIYEATSLSDFVLRYELAVRDRTKVFAVDSVLPCANLSLTCPEDFNEAKSTLLGAEKAIKNLIPVYEARGVIYVKRGALGFLVSKKQDESGLQSLTKKEKEQLQLDFQRTYGLDYRKNTIGVTSVPVDFIRTSMSIQELQPFDETLADAVAIYKCLRVPRHLVPSKDNSTFANAESDMESFYTDTILPWAKRYAEMWTPYFGFERRYIRSNFDHISFLQADRKDEADIDKINGETWEKRWLNSTCSLNEWITSNDGEAGVGPLFEKKLLDLTPDELLKVQAIMQLKAKIAPKNDNATEDGDAPEEGKGASVKE